MWRRQQPSSTQVRSSEAPLRAGLRRDAFQRIQRPTHKLPVILSEPGFPATGLRRWGGERGRKRFSVPGSPKSDLCSLGWSLGVVSRRICICPLAISYTKFRDRNNSETFTSSNERIVIAVGTSSSPPADDGLLLTSTSHERPKHGLETIMLVAKKSDLKNHLSAKHTTFSHKVIAKPTHDQAYETDHQKTSPPEGGPPPKATESEVAETRY